MILVVVYETILALNITAIKTNIPSKFTEYPFNTKRD